MNIHLNYKFDYAHPTINILTKVKSNLITVLHIFRSVYYIATALVVRCYLNIYTEKGYIVVVKVDACSRPVVKGYLHIAKLVGTGVRKGL